MIVNEKNPTQLAIKLIPELLKKNKKKSFSFEEVFSLLVEKKQNLFLDEIGDPRYGILRGIVSRYQKGNLFLKNILITKNKNGILIFKYLDSELLESKKTYVLYLNTINYCKVLKENELTFNEVVSLSKCNQELIKLIYEFNKSLEKFPNIINLKEGSHE